METSNSQRIVRSGREEEGILHGLMFALDNRTRLPQVVVAKMESISRRAPRALGDNRSGSLWDTLGIYGQTVMIGCERLDEIKTRLEVDWTVSEGI